MLRHLTLDRKYQLYVFFLALILHIPAWIINPEGHSLIHNVLWSQHFAEALWSGDFYPRWLIGLNAGCGSPAFFYYPPFPYYVSSLFQWLPSPNAALITVYGLVYALGGVAFYSFIRSSCSAKGALLAACGYLLMPYIWIDLYIRDAYSEYFSFLFLPLLLKLTTNIINGDKKALYFFSCAYALLIMSTVHGALIGSLLIAAYSFYLFFDRKSFDKLPLMVAGGMLGIIISAIYLLPVIEGLPHARIGNTDEMFDGMFDYKSNFAYMNAFSGLVFSLSLFALYAITPALFTGGLRVPFYKNRSFLFWLGAALASLFLMTSLSFFIWLLFPFLKILQFPWRMAIIPTIAIPAMLGYAASALPDRRHTKKIASTYCMMTLVCIGIAFSSPLGVIKINEVYIHNGLVPLPNEYLPSAASSAWLMSDSAQKANALCHVNKVTLLSGDIKPIENLVWKPRHIHFDVHAPEKSTLLIGQFNYWGWQAKDSNGNDILLENSPEGLLMLTLPQGAHSIDIQLVRWKSEVYGAFLSLIGLLAALFGILRVNWIDRKLPS